MMDAHDLVKYLIVEYYIDTITMNNTKIRSIKASEPYQIEMEVYERFKFSDISKPTYSWIWCGNNTSNKSDTLGCWHFAVHVLAPLGCF